MSTNTEKYVPALGFDRLTFLYDPVVRWTTREKEFKTKLVEQANLQDGQKILDVGCGTATLAVALKKSCPSAVVHGLDGDAKVLEIAREKLSRENVEIFLEKNFSDCLPYENNHFDRVVSSLFFHHLTLESKQKTLDEIFRVLKPNGFLCFADWGKPANLRMKIASLLIQWLDGATTKDSFQGLLPKLVAQAGFADVVEVAAFNSVFGTIRLHRSEKK